ncbi:hypothetical protein Tco_0145721 [Tanacetum coccineum]
MLRNIITGIEPDSPEAATGSPGLRASGHKSRAGTILAGYVPGQIADSGPEEDSEDSPVDYPVDGGDDDDDDSSNDDEEEKEASEEEEAEDEEEEHLALADSVVAPVVDHVPSSEETKPFETDEGGVERLLALPPPPSPVISLSPPSLEERLARCLAAPALPSSPLPIVPHPYGSPYHVGAPHAFLSCLGYEVEESSNAAPRPTRGHGIDYGFIGTLDAETRQAVKEVAPTTLEGVNTRVTELAAVQEQDTQDIYAVIEDTQDRQTQLSQRVDISSLHGQLSAALGQIQALQARDQSHADDPEGASSSA